MKTLFLTGASRGVGAALADRLADSWRLILLARNEDSAAELQARHPRASIIAGNLSQESAARSITESIDTMLGDDGLDAFVSCAGIEGAAPLEKMSSSDRSFRSTSSPPSSSPAVSYRACGRRAALSFTSARRPPTSTSRVGCPIRRARPPSKRRPLCSDPRSGRSG